MEKVIAPSSPTAEEQKVMRAFFDNCWELNVH